MTTTMVTRMNDDWDDADDDDDDGHGVRCEDEDVEEWY